MNVPRIEARRWWQQAQADLAVVRTLRSAGHHAAACFQSQQAAEFTAADSGLSAFGTTEPLPLHNTVQGYLSQLDDLHLTESRNYALIAIISPAPIQPLSQFTTAV